ncbi:hypothetical protein U1Q18_044208 [Sarracenia purpurea var. burkii]
MVLRTTTTTDQTIFKPLSPPELATDQATTTVSLLFSPIFKIFHHRGAPWGTWRNKGGGRNHGRSSGRRSRRRPCRRAVATDGVGGLREELEGAFGEEGVGQERPQVDGAVEVGGRSRRHCTCSVTQFRPPCSRCI